MAEKKTLQPAEAAGYDMKPGVLVTFDADSVKETVAALADRGGVKNVAYAADFESAADMGQLSSAGMTVFANLGVAVADLDPDQEMGIASLPGAPGPVAAIEPEPIFFAFDGAAEALETYLRGYRDAVDHIYDQAFGSLGAAAAPGTPSSPGAFADDDLATWGLNATKVTGSNFSGRGVRVAVLDTGFDLDHPDFRGRSVTTASFIPGQLVQDDNGHGTHCIGTACGAKAPTRGRRYGIAHEAEIFAGKVLTNQGSALGRSTLAGIEWAVRNRCHIVSMSLGGLVLPGQTFLQAFENTARQAMAQNTLIIAAAGNDSRRSQGAKVPVSSPANCPSIMAVAAVDRTLRVADFSNSAINPDAAIDIAGPGVEVYSSAPEPAAPPQPPRFRHFASQYEVLNGTSMATPHVAGIAALLKEANPTLTSGALWRLLVSRARTLQFPASDVGAGLVQA
jgi:subtilisin